MWIVTLPCDGFSHTPAITRWIHDTFGQVAPGAVRSYKSQDYWFGNLEDALATWFAWN